jgi:hypothetical protein
METVVLHRVILVQGIYSPFTARSVLIRRIEAPIKQIN